MKNKEFDKKCKLNIIESILKKNNEGKVRSDDLELFFNAIEQHKLNRAEVELMIREFGLDVVRGVLKYRAFRLLDTSLYTICEEMEETIRLDRGVA